jgi:GT2 family glycosyltransferase
MTGDRERDSQKTSVVIVTYRRPEMLRDCLASVSAAIDHSRSEIEVVVVENGLCERTAELLAIDFPFVRHLRFEENRGFTLALVSGIEMASGRWIATLNDDATLDRNALAELQAAMSRHPEAWAFCAQLRFASRPEVINSAGLEIDQLGIAADRLLGEHVSASERSDTEVFGVSGGAAIYEKSTLLGIGSFDSTFFGYLEDADLAWRAQMRGLRSFYVPDAVVYHHHSATFKHGSPEKLWLVGRNRVRLLAKNASRQLLVRRGWLMVLYDLGYVIYTAVMARSLAALTGRLQGIREWRAYRSDGKPSRAPVRLVPSRGFGGALRRHRVWGG